ncbi:hypothetical protein HanLR1_Chr00c0892g0779831 [Helianthus annuus]|nr:hypothetical protein HanLR1_Chr00c0892g0779831 [Helianthus annuus]
MLVLQQDDPNLCMLLIIVDLDARCLSVCKNVSNKTSNFCWVNSNFSAGPFDSYPVAKPHSCTR